VHDGRDSMPWGAPCRPARASVTTYKSRVDVTVIGSEPRARVRGPRWRHREGRTSLPLRRRDPVIIRKECPESSAAAAADCGPEREAAATGRDHGAHGQRRQGCIRPPPSGHGAWLITRARPAIKEKPSPAWRTTPPAAGRHAAECLRERGVSVQRHSMDASTSHVRRRDMRGRLNAAENSSQEQEWHTGPQDGEGGETPSARDDADNAASRVVRAGSRSALG